MIFLEGLERFFERTRDGWNLREFFLGKLKDVFVERTSRIDFVLDAVESGHEHGRISEIRIARWIGRTELEPFRFGIFEYTGMRTAAERFGFE